MKLNGKKIFKYEGKSTQSETYDLLKKIIFSEFLTWARGIYVCRSNMTGASIVIKQ